MGAKPPPGPVKSGGFQAHMGAEPPPGKIKKFKPPLDKFLNTLLDVLYVSFNA